MFNISFWFTFFMLNLLGLLLHAQQDVLRPSLTFSEDRHIENRIALDMPRKLYKTVRKSEGEKYELEKVKLSVNGQQVTVKSVGLHGNSTLDFPRKSYSVTLRDTAFFHRGDSTKGIRRFHLLSLSMDEYYYRNRLSFGCLQQLGLFPLFFAYAELRINGENQGIYMVVQKPHDYALNELKAPALLRRHYYNEIKKTKVDKENAEYGKKDYKQAFEEIYVIAKNYKEKGFYDSLNHLLDMDAYLQWLGFNYFICNGDYTDEVYFVAQPDRKDIRFGVLAWDYDDIFAEEPHEGEFARERLIGACMLFSAEDALDRGIARNEESYGHYLQALQHVNTHFSPDSLRWVFEETYAELYPYFAEPEVLECSSLDPMGKVDLQGLREELSRKYAFLVKRHEEIKMELKKREAH